MNTRQHWIDPAMATIAAAVLAGLMGLVCGPARAEIAQYPLSVTQAIPPQVILALSKDEQLFKAAYDDITDIDDDGFLEATYDNSFDYYGYFDPNACYSYSGNGYFAPATEASSHQCTGLWSGNFLNWATMTRMDLLRRVLYGGYRSVDTTSQTILERALITRDSHAFAKVFAPDGGATDVAHYTPFAVTAVTLCNVTEAPSGRSQELNTATYPPLIKVAAGNWRLWAIGDPFDMNLPCAWEANSAEQNTAPHNSAGEALGTFKARVKVCGENLPEANCKQYPQQGSARKPTGILQKFGDEQGVRFGMVSGSYQKNVSGGVLRRKSGYTAGNDLANVAQDEVDLQNGIFTGNSGIIKTIDSFTLNGFDFATNTYTDNCLAPNSSDLSDGSCTNWGNPIAEIVLESLRYLAGAEHPSDEYDADDSGVNAALAPIQDWGDPISERQWCTKSNILVVTGGVNSFDKDEFGGETDISELDSIAETDAVGSAEGIGGHYVLGGNALESDGNCYAREINSLSEAQGVCPSGGSLKGGWEVSGMAYHAHVKDMRDDRYSKQTVATRAIDMKDPTTFEFYAGGQPVTVAPYCVYNTDPNATAMKVKELVDGGQIVLPENTESHGWTQCAKMEPRINSEKDLVYDEENRLVAGDYYIDWWDISGGSSPVAVTRIHFCSKGYCSDDKYSRGWIPETEKGGGQYTLPESLQDNEIRMTTSAVSVNSPNAMAFGFVVSGTASQHQYNDDWDHCDNGFHGNGAYLEEVYPGNVEYDETKYPNSERRFCGRRYKPATSDEDSAPILHPPLWYATKFGSFIDTNDNGLPDLQAEWDSDADGNPDGYHMLYAPQRIGESFESIFDLIAGVSSSSSVVANTLVLKTGTYIYQGRFDSSDWSGDLVAFPVHLNGSLGEIEWSARDKMDHQFGQSRWDSDRIVITSRWLDGRFRGVPFRWDNLSFWQKTALNWNFQVGGFDYLGEERLNFLRGDRGDEVQNGGNLRDRNHLLGDIVNSDPLYVGKPPFNYREDGYNTFVRTYRDRTPILYVGANDGMLHGFDAGTGEERLAYVPRAVYDRLPWLAALDYERSHRFFVDGGLIAGDALVNFWGYSNDGWRSVLVGTLGAGGKGVYALDVTDPSRFSEGDEAAAKLVLWDIKSSDPGFGDLGYTFSAPAIVRLPVSGRWVAAIGNGYESDGGKAVLYLLGIEDGDIVARVEADAGPGNGLSSVAPVDLNGDHAIDYIYAGDLKGNLWRFEQDDSGNWQVGLGGQPLFTARDANGKVQPITVRPAVFSHPYRGVMVVVGTGKFFEVSDAAADTSVVQSLYGVWDRLDGTAAITRRDLLRQEFVAAGNSNGYDLRVTSTNPMTWYTGEEGDARLHLGWYLDLEDPLADSEEGDPRGELIAAEIRVRGDRVIFTSMIPSDEPCDYGGEGWLIELSYLTGKRPSGVLFDLDGDGDFDSDDMISMTADDGGGGDGQGTTAVGANAKKSKIGIIQQPAIIGDGDKEYKFASGGMPASVEVTRENPGRAAGMRASWQELQ